MTTPMAGVLTTPDEAHWAAECITPLDDPTAPGATLDEPRTSFTLWLLDRGLPAPNKRREDAKRWLRAIGYSTGRRDGATHWKGIAVTHPTPPHTDSEIRVGTPGSLTADFDDPALYDGLAALVVSGMTTPREADLALIHMTQVPYALCRFCGSLTRNTTARAHIGCTKGGR